MSTFPLVSVAVKQPLLALSLAAAITGSAAVGVLLIVGSDPSSAAASISGSSTDAGKGNGKGNNGNGNGNTGQPGNPAKSFTIIGAVEGLAPGVTVRLRPTVQNPNNQAIRVTAMTVTLPAGTCSDMLSVGAWVGSAFNVASNGTAGPSSTPTVDTGYFPITMSDSATNDCADRTFSLTYSGTAGQA